MSLQRINTFDLGLAWGGNSVNALLFSQNLVSRHDFQYAAFYSPEKKLVIVQRNLKQNQITSTVIDHVPTLNDAHFSISLGIDRKGFLHISYAQHMSQLVYRRTSKPHRPETFGPIQPMTGHLEKPVTYPFFLFPNQDDGDNFFFIYRRGGSDYGEVLIKVYDIQAQTWSDLPNAILTGMTQKPWTSGPYLQRPILDQKGNIHFLNTWRTHSIGDAKRINNINLDYLTSPDGGKNWYTSTGQPLQLPVTQVNSETIVPIGPGANLMNQSGATLDHHGHPLSVYYANDSAGVPQYQLIRHQPASKSPGLQSHSKWVNTLVSHRTQPFNLEGIGTLKVPISRPDVVVLHDNTPMMIYRSEETQQCLVAKVLSTNTDTTEYPLSPPVGDAEPVIDHHRWQRDGVLSMLIQNCEQGHQEGYPPQIASPISIAEWQYIS
jgi:hypothetical protein